MAKRPIKAKKIAKLRKALRVTPTARIDLVHYLRLHGYAQTAGEARRLLTEGKVRYDSHVVGRSRQSVIGKDGKTTEAWVAQPLVPASYRGKLLVLP